MSKRVTALFLLSFPKYPTRDSDPDRVFFCDNLNIKNTEL